MELAGIGRPSGVAPFNRGASIMLEPTVAPQRRRIDDGMRILLRKNPRSCEIFPV
jgi:hypothetical protein